MAKLCITEFNEQVFVNGIREEGREEERKLLIMRMHSQGLSISQIAIIVQCSEHEIAKQLQNK